MLKFFDDASIYTFPILAATITILLITLLYLLKDMDLPPGPIGLPFLGYYPFLQSNYHLQLQTMAKKYGDVFSLRITGQLYIHISSLKALREAHISKGDYFIDRMSSYNVLQECFENGLSFINGEKWKVLRKFYVQNLKEYGMSSLKDSMAGPLYDSIQASIEDIKTTEGAPFDIIALLTKHCTQTIQQLLFGGAEISKEDMDTLNAAYMDMMGGMMERKMVLGGPIAKYLILPFSASHRSMIAGKKVMKNMLERLVKTHETSLDEDHPRDLVDSYFRERNVRARQNDPSAEYFNVDELTSTLMQLVGDGVIAVASFIAVFLKCVVEHPEVEEKIYQELVEVVGRDRQPSWEDKIQLIYCNAVILEILRAYDILSIFPSRECSRQTTLNGYKIPRGSVTLVNNWAIYHDPELYDDPDKFDPSRFIAAPGKPKPETPMPFGIGKRACAGEPFVMMQVYMFMLTIVKNFKLSLPNKDGKFNPVNEMEMEICAYLRSKS